MIKRRKQQFGKFITNIYKKEGIRIVSDLNKKFDKVKPYVQNER